MSVSNGEFIELQWGTSVVITVNVLYFGEGSSTARMNLYFWLLTPMIKLVLRKFSPCYKEMNTRSSIKPATLLKVPVGYMIFVFISD